MFELFRKRNRARYLENGRRSGIVSATALARYLCIYLLIIYILSTEMICTTYHATLHYTHIPHSYYVFRNILAQF